MSEKRTWWQSVRHKAKVARDAIVGYVPTGIVSAAVMTAGATAIGYSGWLGGVGDFIGNTMGATSIGDGAMKVVRIVILGASINGVASMAKSFSGKNQEAGNTQQTPGQQKDDKSHSMGLEHAVDLVSNDPEITVPDHLPSKPTSERGMNVPGIC